MKTPFDEFQLSEYENISKAHFETVQQISIFFRYYILFISAPVAILLILYNEKENIINIFSQNNSEFIKYLALFLIGISVIGFFLCLYLINLRQDAVLYARTVNGIRKYFIDKSGLNSLQECRYRVLPTNIYKPDYYETFLFFPVIFVFIVINSAYYLCGVALIMNSYSVNNMIIYLIVHFLGFASLHIFSYKRLAVKRDLYLRSKILGIDIDGILNDHRMHFCKILNEMTGKKLAPEDIIKIPVHKIPGITITQKDEHLVFNNLKYWNEMPTIESDLSCITRISKELGYKIYIFTNRPWPNCNLIESEKIKEDINKLWKNHSIKKITKEWLAKNKIVYDKLYFEKNSKDRFDISKKINFRYVVEDDPINAKRISNFCDFVFLMKQPYNGDGVYPQNVIPVICWAEIFEHMKQLD